MLFFKNKTISINNVGLIVELADNHIKKAIGLMYRKRLPYNNGMLFIFSKNKYLKFWMLFTRIPLSIAFINSEGIITEIINLFPGSLKTITSKEKIRFALEVNQNYFSENNIKTGDRVKGLH
jgi:hypothetical protein